MKKILKYIPGAAALTLLLAFTACNVSSPSYTGKTSQTQHRFGGKKSHRDVAPHDRQQFILDKSAKTYTPEDLRKGVVKGDWSIVQVNGKTPVGQEAPYIKFDLNNKQVYAYNGCNHLNGSYTYKPSDKTLRFGDDMISTMRACGETGITDMEINQAMASVRTYSWELRDPQFFLYLYDSKGTCVLTLMHQSFDFLNGSWAVKAIDDEAVDIPDLRFVIDVNDSRVFGRGDCLSIDGKLLTEMDAPNSISFQALVLTRTGNCPVTDYENDLIVAFEDAATAKPIGPTKVMLYNNHNIPVLELERIKIK